MRLEERRVALAQIGTGDDPQPVELFRGARPNAVEAPDLQPGDEIRPGSGRDDELTVGLVVIRGELGEELIVRNARRARFRAG